MIIKSAEYICTAVYEEQYPEHDLPEIAVVGRSNVGKSSLINRIANRKHLARTSGKPGKTRTINFFMMNEAFYLVDLPGYGYAQVPKEMKKQWGQMINTYLERRRNLIATVLLVDMRHKPSVEDIQMYSWLQNTHPQVIIACTKADKISRGKWPHHMKIIRQALEMRKTDVIIPVSSLHHEGVEPLMLEMEHKLEEDQAIIK
ncbi:YihA family ribosome biogenesis GTP-binding protein [Clostridia bacterium]|nr:YihA family ribosome biogenesis GTP-binding protein [Clostridia bacterium]